MDDMMKITEEEMSEVSGGKRHFSPEPEKAGWIQYKVEAHDTLIRIAEHFGISNWRKIIEWNPHIDKKTNMIRTGEYLWIKK